MLIVYISSQDTLYDPSTFGTMSGSISREERFKLERWSLYGFQGYTQVSLEVQTVKNLPAMGETWVGEHSLEEGRATCSSILAWRISMDRGAWWAPVHGVTKSWAQLSN